MNKYLLVILTFLSNPVLSATYYSRATGNWNSSSTWSTVGCGGTAAASTPTAGDVVTICNGHTVSVTANVTTGSVTISNGGSLKTGTTASGANKTVTITGTFTIQDGGTYTHNNNQTAATTIFAGTESFAANSTIKIDSWSGTNDSLVNGVSSNFGNLNFNWDTGAFLWKNSGLGSFRTIAGSLTTNLNCATYLDNSALPVTITIGGNLSIGDEFRVKTSNPGNTTLNVGGTISIASADALFMGVYQGNGNFTMNAANVNLSAGTLYGIYNGDGNYALNVSAAYTQSGGTLLGIRNNVTYTAGVPSYSFQTVNFTGGFFLGNSSCNTTNGIIQFHVSNNMNITFNDTVSIFAINRLATLGSTSTTCGLNMSVGGNMTIGGTANGEFNANNGNSAETIVINGTLSVSAGKNYFNVIPAFGSNGHGVTFTANALNISGGSLYLSAETGTLNATVTNATTISGGTLVAKGNTGSGTVNLNSFTQTGGLYYLHNNTATISANPVTVSVNGSFSQSGGTISFSNNTLAGNATNVLSIKGSSYSIGTSGIITRSGAGTNTQFGLLQFSSGGTTTFSRTGSHSIQQVKQTVTGGTLLDVISGNVQVASHAAAATDYFTVASAGTLNLRTAQLYSDASFANSGITVADGGRLKTQHASGLYNNSTTAAISNAGNMNYFLGSSSVVEYNGTATQVLTGINTGLATGTQHKYGILDINFTGPANTSWVYPTSVPSATTAIYIRNELRLTSGELNLANNSAVASNGGRTITIENGTAGAITRIAGYIKSETEDFSGIVKWLIGSNAGNHIIPFGSDATGYIPLAINISSGITGDASFSTYHTAANNLPWPPDVTNLISAIGLSPDNRDATTDRYWMTSFTGSPSAALSLNYLSTEIPASPYNNTSSLRAHRYNTTGSNWESALPGQIAGSNSISVPSIPNAGIWTLANTLSPLPVELLSFSAKSAEEGILIEWVTAKEKDNDYFIVERTTDFEKIATAGIVEAASFPSAINYYELLDKTDLSGTIYYRLKQVDIDGRTKTYNWIAVKTEADEFNIYPNPAADFIYIPELMDGNILITSADGKIVWARVQNHMADVSKIASGIYSISSEKGSTSKQIIISR